MIENIDAIRALVPDAEMVYSEGMVTQWLDDRQQPTDEEIAAKKLELQAEYDAKEYQRNRAVAYPQLGEQFDKLWHDINNGTLDNTGEFFTALKEVKDNNPKPGA
jgi:hypothetical protein